MAQYGTHGLITATQSIDVARPETGCAPRQVDFEGAYLLLLDFDGNVGDTFQPSPAGVGVEENYDNTLEQIFGSQILSTYHAAGGLRNRAPAEVIHELFIAHPGVIELAHAHLQDHPELSEVMLPTVPNLSLWESDSLKAATEVYIRQDLINSLEHIGMENPDGTLWPRTCTGFEVFYRAVERLNEESKGVFHITTGIISSGYVEYIKKCFDIWKLKQPDIWVTDDQTRARKYPTTMTNRVKPAPFGVALAHQEWLRMYGLSGQNFWTNPDRSRDHIDYKWLDAARAAKERMFYFGDGLSKDGEMARRARIGFGHFNPGTIAMNHGGHTTFGDWGDVARQLEANKAAFLGRSSISSIIRNEAVAA